MSVLRQASILLGSTDPDRLRAFYQEVFDLEPFEGFLRFGTVRLLIDGRDDVAERTAEPGRTVLTVETDDMSPYLERLRARGVTWVCEPEERRDGWFSTFYDPDGNLVQVISLNDAYFERQRG